MNLVVLTQDEKSIFSIDNAVMTEDFEIVSFCNKNEVSYIVLGIYTSEDECKAVLTQMFIKSRIQDCRYIMPKSL